VATVSVKGGVGKTTVAAGVALTLARYRPERVVAVDANLHAGTLADRLVAGSPKASVQHLLDDLLEESVSLDSVGDIDRYVHLAERLSVLAGHHDPSVGAAFAGDDYAELVHTLGRFFHTIVADCGTGLADEAMRALLDHTHTLLLVATSCEDAVMLAEKTLHWLAGHGYPHLVENCIAVMCHASSTRGAPRTVRSRFAGLCATVIDIPADPQLAQGGAIRLDELTIDVQTAYASVAAAVVDAAPPDATAGQRSWARSLSSSPLASARHTGR
jgi:MinD-like ATPase involved in chromosome partitioning or flagellar assembly